MGLQVPPLGKIDSTGLLRRWSPIHGAVFPQFMVSTTGGFVHGSETVSGALVDAWEAR